MPKSHRPYSAEFRQRIVELVRKGRTPEELGRQFEPSAQCIRNWVRQAERDAGRRQDGLTTVEQEELRRLRRENRALREERELPGRAEHDVAGERVLVQPGEVLGQPVVRHLAAAERGQHGGMDALEVDGPRPPASRGALAGHGAASAVSLIRACAAASRAVGIMKGEHET